MDTLCRWAGSNAQGAYNGRYGSPNRSYVNPCVQTVVAAAIAVYVVAGALTSVDQRLSRRADRGCGDEGKSYQTI